MSTTAQIRAWWADRRCSGGIVMAASETWGRSPVRTQPEYADAVAAMFQTLLDAGYEPTTNWPTSGYIGSRRLCPAGINGATCQDDGTNCSLHNYCLAWDIEYDLNPHLHVNNASAEFLFARCKLTEAQVRAVEAIRTNDGQQIFVWLGWSIGDTMHFQANVSPTSIGTGLDPSTIGDDMNYITWLQTFCNDMGYTDYEDKPLTVDGKDGPRTQSAKAKFQADLAKVGPEGPRGPQGAAGIQGPQGPKGDQGPGLTPGTTLELSNTATITKLGG